MRVLITGGGTGGHLFPGLAVAQALQRRDPHAAVLFVGSERGIEARAVPASGFAIETLPLLPLRGRGMGERIAALAAFAAALWRARRVLRRFAPDAVVGLGGYASAPAVVAARLARRPIVLLEQNARPGFTTRWLARLADRICVSFPETVGHFRPGQAVFTGNPVRWRTAHAAHPPGTMPGARGEGGAPSVPAPDAVAEPRPGFTILVFGGSAGARRLNQAAPVMCAALADMRDLKVIHQTGAGAEAEVAAAYAAGTVQAEVHAFITDMGAAYAAADLVICRAGATTVAELAGLGKPAILVPYPHAADDHQRSNAASLVRAGAARLVPDAEATGERLAAEIRSLRAVPGQLAEMGRRACQFGKTDAAERVLETLAAVVQERGRTRREGH